MLFWLSLGSFSSESAYAQQAHLHQKTVYTQNSETLKEAKSGRKYFHTMSNVLFFFVQKAYLESSIHKHCFYFPRPTCYISETTLFQLSSLFTYWFLILPLQICQLSHRTEIAILILCLKSTVNVAYVRIFYVYLFSFQTERNKKEMMLFNP